MPFKELRDFLQSWAFEKFLDGILDTRQLASSKVIVQTVAGLPLYCRIVTYTEAPSRPDLLHVRKEVGFESVIFYIQIYCTLVEYLCSWPLDYLKKRSQCNKNLRTTLSRSL